MNEGGTSKKILSNIYGLLLFRRRRLEAGAGAGAGAGAASVHKGHVARVHMRKHGKAVLVQRQHQHQHAQTRRLSRQTPRMGRMRILEG